MNIESLQKQFAKMGADLRVETREPMVWETLDKNGRVIKRSQSGVAREPFTADIRETGKREHFLFRVDDRPDVPIYNPVLFDTCMADQILAWLDQYATTLEGVLVHCAAGVSRSAAVAKFIAARYDLPFNEARASLYNRWVYGVLWDRWTQDEEVQRQILAARDSV